MSHSRNRSEAKLAKYLYDAVEATDTRYPVFSMLYSIKHQKSVFLDPVLLILQPGSPAMGLLQTFA